MANGIEASGEFFMRKVIPWVDELCRSTQHPNRLAAYLLGGIYLKLGELVDSATFGANYFRISPYVLAPTPVRILEKDPDKRVRKISVWIDNASGGPTPTIRINQGSGSGGFRVNAGQVNEIGEISPDTELWGSSTLTAGINAYVIERA